MTVMMSPSTLPTSPPLGGEGKAGQRLEVLGALRRDTWVSGSSRSAVLRGQLVALKDELPLVKLLATLDRVVEIDDTA